MGIVYRTFRNDDPPKLQALWNDALTSRGTAFIPSADAFERFIFNKPWFDPTGLILAVDEETKNIVGMTHGGFGQGSDKTLDRSKGIITLIMVHPDFLRQKIGWTLLTKMEDYLSRHGADKIQVGCRWPDSPFYWGLVGGSTPIGVPNSAENAREFLAAAGYHPEASYTVLHRNLDEPISLGDPRFPVLRRKFDVRQVARHQEATLYGEATRNIHEGMTFEVRQMASDQLVGHVQIWDMKFFTLRWKKHAVGLYDFHLQEDLRGQGLGKYALSQTLRSLKESFYQLVEVNVPKNDANALTLFEKVGFVPVDEGAVYTKG